MVHASKPVYKSAEFIDSSDSDDPGDIEYGSPDPPISPPCGLSEDGDETLVELGEPTGPLLRDSTDRELEAAKFLPKPPAAPPNTNAPSDSRRGPKKRKEKATEPADHPVHKITYNLLMFPVEELAKDDVKKRRGKSAFLKLNSDLPFDTFKAQLLVKISAHLQPDTISFDDYEVSFSIPRISPTPLSVTEEDDYIELIQRVKKAKNFEANIYIQQRSVPELKRKDHSGRKDLDHPRKDINESSDEERMAKCRKKKNQGTNNDVEVEQPVNTNIKLLRSRYVCNKKPMCPSEHCFVNPANGSHIPLTFSRLECWASAMLKGPQFATIEMPPNHKEFILLSDENLGPTSLLSARRQELQDRAKVSMAATAVAAPNAPTAPIINVNFPAEMFHLFGPQSPVLNTSAAMCGAGRSVHHPVSPPKKSLLTPAQLQSLGSRLPLDEFCALYDISKDLQRKLSENGYTTSHSLRFATIEDLDRIGVLRGELAQLRDSVSRWCNEA
ncbi:hypothetical protein EDD15DRAFT_2365882 [Pisolithus albus]|nr:hypothetical protein EDD15DRAFT_2365882 [Pisolithus albus]